MQTGSSSKNHNEPLTKYGYQQGIAVSGTDLSTSAHALGNAIKYTSLAENGPLASFVVSQFKSSAIINVTFQYIKYIGLPNLKYRHLKESVSFLVEKDCITAGSKGRRFDRNKHLKVLLKWTWEVIVKPILCNLDLLRGAESESALPKIWWVFSGLMEELLLLHASGIHSRGLRDVIS